MTFSSKKLFGGYFMIFLFVLSLFFFAGYFYGQQEARYNTQKEFFSIMSQHVFPVDNFTGIYVINRSALVDIAIDYDDERERRERK